MLDDIIVVLTGVGGILLAQFSTTAVENITPIGIVAIVVYFFLVKFDRKMDSQDRKIDLVLERIKQHGRLLRQMKNSNDTDDDIEGDNSESNED